MIDKGRYPRTAIYLSQLPQGLDSHPEAQVKAEAHEGLRKVFQEAGETLPEPFQSFVDGRMRGEWVPEVFGNALLLLARDTVFKTDQDFLAWVYKNMEQLSLHPVYRMMMRVFSITLVIMGTAKRWETFHRGTSLESSPVETVHGRDQAVLTLTHPAKLYNKLLLENLNTLYLVILKVCHAEDFIAEAEQMSDTVSRFRVSWKA